MKFNHRIVRIQWGDCDPARIVFYPNYFRWFDEGTRDLFEVAGLAQAELFDRYKVVGVPLVDARATFKSPARFGDDITVSSGISAFRGKTFEVTHRITKGDLLLVEGLEIRVWGEEHPDDPKRLRAAVIPPEVIAALSESANA